MNKIPLKFLLAASIAIGAITSAEAQFSRPSSSPSSPPPAATSTNRAPPPAPPASSQPSGFSRPSPPPVAQPATPPATPPAVARPTPAPIGALGAAAAGAGAAAAYQSYNSERSQAPVATAAPEPRPQATASQPATVQSPVHHPIPSQPPATYRTQPETSYQAPPIFIPVPVQGSHGYAPPVTVPQHVTPHAQQPTSGTGGVGTGWIWALLGIGLIGGLVYLFFFRDR